MSKARELAELIGNAGGTSEQVLSGRRNLIINGDFRVRQRGSTQPDRWFNMVGMSVDGSVTSHLKFTSTSADPYQWYKVEDVGMSLASKVATWSFWAKSSDGGNPIQYFAYTGSSTAGQIFPEPTGETDSAGFSRFEFQITLDSSTYTDRHEFRFEYRAVSGITIEMKEVQLELGSVATPFEHRSYGEELALCMRYYQQSSDNATNTSWYSDNGGTLLVDMEDVAMSGMRFPVIMRTTPTFTFYVGTETNAIKSYGGNATRYGTSVYIANHGLSGIRHDGGYQLGRPYGCNWTADAEL